MGKGSKRGKDYIGQRYKEGKKRTMRGKEYQKGRKWLKKLLGSIRRRFERGNVLRGEK